MQFSYCPPERYDVAVAQKKKHEPKHAPNFLTCPVPGIQGMLDSEQTLKTPAPKQLPYERTPSRVAEPKRSLFRKRMTAQAPHATASQVHVAQGSALDRAIPPVPQHASAAHPKRRVRRRWVGLTVLVIVVIVAATTGPAVYALIRAGVAAQSAKTTVQRAADLARQGNAEEAAQALGDASQDLSGARDALRGTGFWRDVPGVGTQVRAMEDAATAGASTLDGMRDLARVAGDILNAAASANATTGVLVNPVEAHRSFSDLTPEEKRAMLARLDRSLPDIRAAQAKVTVALEAWNRIPQDRLFAPLRSALAPVAQQLPALKRSLDEAVPLLSVFLPIAGYPTPTDYLVVLQNQDEIRATGGFLGTWGILSLDGGDLKEFSFNDVYTLDNPVSATWKEVPPAPLSQRLGVPAWFFRDANWSPDFPTSAARMSDFYVRETKLGTGKDVKPPDGVIAVNPPLFKGLLRMTGPITVDDVTFTEDNFFDVLEFEVEQRFLEQGIPHDQRKQILLKLGDALMQKIMSLPASQWPDLLDLLTNALDHKQMQIFARDPSLLAQLDAFHWTGRTKPTSGDFVWVIDSNLAALKTDGIMTKRVRYELDATDPAHPVATVTLRYSNDGPRIGTDFRYTRYRDYVRVYVPEGAELISSSGAMKDDRYRTGGRMVPGPVDVYRELGKTVFGAFWSIEPKTTQELTFRYRLPPSALVSGVNGAGDGYHLDIPKQSGNDDASLTLDLRFGKNLRSAVPSEDPSRFGDAAYFMQTDAATDRAFDVVF